MAFQLPVFSRSRSQGIGFRNLTLSKTILRPLRDHHRQITCTWQVVVVIHMDPNVLDPRFQTEPYFLIHCNVDRMYSTFKQPSSKLLVCLPFHHPSSCHRSSVTSFVVRLGGGGNCPKKRGIKRYIKKQLDSKSWVLRCLIFELLASNYLEEERTNWGNCQRLVFERGERGKLKRNECEEQTKIYDWNLERIFEGNVIK